MRTALWTDSVSVLDRVTAVLDSFGEDDALGVSEIARRANLPKSTVSRIVADLVHQRYLDRDGSRLQLGLKLFELGQAVERPARLRHLAHPLMLQLREMTGATVSLAVLDGPDVVVIASIGNRTTGTRLAAENSVLGRAMLAHVSEAGTPEVLREFADIRRNGFASVVGLDDMTCVASAILAGSTVPVGAIAVTGSMRTFDASRVGGLVRSAAAALGRRWDQRTSR